MNPRVIVNNRPSCDEPLGSIRSGLGSDLGLLTGERCSADEPSSPLPPSPLPHSPTAMQPPQHQPSLPPPLARPGLVPELRPDAVPQPQPQPLPLSDSDAFRARQPRTEHIEAVVLSLALTILCLPLGLLEPFPLMQYAPPVTHCHCHIAIVVALE